MYWFSDGDMQVSEQRDWNCGTIDGCKADGQLLPSKSLEDGPKHISRGIANACASRSAVVPVLLLVTKARVSYRSDVSPVDGLGGNSSLRRAWTISSQARTAYPLDFCCCRTLKDQDGGTMVVY